MIKRMIIKGELDDFAFVCCISRNVLILSDGSDRCVDVVTSWCLPRTYAGGIFCILKNGSQSLRIESVPTRAIPTIQPITWRTLQVVGRQQFKEMC